MPYLKPLYKYTKLTVGTIVVSGILYFGTIIGADFVSNSTAPKIESQYQLEKLLDIEREKLGINRNIVIEAKLVSDLKSHCEMIDETHYEIVLGDFFANESSLKHELYHISDDHHIDNRNTRSKFQKILKYYFWYEPQAIIYEVTGLNL